MYVNDLAINSLKYGVLVDETMLTILMYAADIALTAPNECSLQSMLNVLHEWSTRWQLSVNMNKTNVIHFRNHNRDHQFHSSTLGKHWSM